MNLFMNHYYNTLENELILMMNHLNLSIEELKCRTIEKSNEDGKTVSYYVDDKLMLTVMYNEIKGGIGSKKVIQIEEFKIPDLFYLEDEEFERFLRCKVEGHQ